MVKLVNNLEILSLGVTIAAVAKKSLYEITPTTAAILKVCSDIAGQNTFVRKISQIKEYLQINYSWTILRLHRKFRFVKGVRRQIVLEPRDYRID